MTIVPYSPPLLVLVTWLCLVVGGQAFSSVLFPKAAPTQQRSVPSSTAMVDIELPDFNELFERIQQVSPLARVVMCNNNFKGSSRGFNAVDDSWPSHLDWKTVELNKRRVVHHIEKIDNFQGHAAPILRFRSSMKGPCVGECFAAFIMDLDQRKKWDSQIDQVYEIHPIHDLDAANIAMGFGRYGDCSRMGVGYCQTKATAGISSREQLTLCGIQDFADSSCIIWGIEMEERHNNLLPDGPRHTRARTHLFSTTLTPTSDDTFDVEYVLQLDIGGKIPSWLAGPIVTENVKQLFRTAASFFADHDGSLEKFLEAKAKQDSFHGRHSLLMTF